MSKKILEETSLSTRVRNSKKFLKEEQEKDQNSLRDCQERCSFKLKLICRLELVNCSFYREKE